MVTLNDFQMIFLYSLIFAKSIRGVIRWIQYNVIHFKKCHALAHNCDYSWFTVVFRLNRNVNVTVCAWSLRWRTTPNNQHRFDITYCWTLMSAIDKSNLSEQKNIYSELNQNKWDNWFQQFMTDCWYYCRLYISITSII